MVTAQISFHYHELFDRVGHVYLSSSIFRGFIEYPFALQPPRYIGREFYGSEETNANTGILGISFMHFGYFGMLVFTFLLGIVCKMVDFLPQSKKNPLFIAVAFLLVLGTIMVSADFFSGMLTNGYIALYAFLLISAMFSSGNKSKEKASPNRPPATSTATLNLNRT